MNIFKRTLCILMACLPVISFASTLHLPIVSVVDGDTIISEVKSHPPELQKIYIRLRGIDTPELRKYKCPEEKLLAQQAKEFLTSFLSDYKMLTVDDIDFDKYGQRIVGTVYVKQVNVNQLMIDKGFAHPYTGQGQKTSWCNK